MFEGVFGGIEELHRGVLTERREGRRRVVQNGWTHNATRATVIRGAGAAAVLSAAVVLGAGMSTTTGVELEPPPTRTDPGSLAPLVRTKVLLGGDDALVFDPPLVAQVASPERGLFVATESEIHLDSFAGTYAELDAGLDEHLRYMWRAFVDDDEEHLAEEAREVRRALLKRVKVERGS